MSSIGPQLPPHLQKRKRTPEEEDGSPDSPPAKVTRRGNDDEIDLDNESSDDEYGPSAGPAQAATKKAPQQGPSLPTSRKDDTTDRPQPSIGPSMPPPPPSDSNRKQTLGPSLPPPSSRTVGPTPPPAPLSARPTTNPDSDSDDDDDYGPAMPTATTSTTSLFDAPQAFLPASAAPKRDDWMLAPPSQSGYQAPDPTKLKSRKFASGRSANAAEAHAGGISSIWTETPEEKAKRLRDAVLGRGDVTQGTQAPAAKAAVMMGPARTAADEEKIRAFTEQTRGRSLVEEHQMKKKVAADSKKKKGEGDDGEEEEDDPSKRAFNWEKDMKAGGSISHTQRRELLNRSADFGGRFQKGSYL